MIWNICVWKNNYGNYKGDKSFFTGSWNFEKQSEKSYSSDVF